MQLYTLISLLIGVFGGAYAALNALRTHLDDHFKGHISEARSNLQHVQKNSENLELKNQSESSSKRAIRAYTWWKWINMVPAGMFAVAIFITVVAALKDWDQVVVSTPVPGAMDHFPWCFSRVVLTIMLVVNMTAIVAACAAYWLGFDSCGRIKSNFAIVAAEEAAKVNRAPAISIAPISSPPAPSP